MNLRQALWTALSSLAVNKLRSALTLIGMGVGVGAVILITALGSGVQGLITAQINSLGTNLVFVDPGQTRSPNGVTSQAGAVQTITYDDAKAIEDPNNVPSAVLVSPEVYAAGQFIYQAQNTTGTVNGVVPEYGDLHNYRVSQGDWIGDDQVQAASSVVVLGSAVANTLFGSANPIGSQIRINAGTGQTSTYMVIGVGESKGGAGFNNPDTGVYIPLTTALHKLNRPVSATGAQTVSHIAAQAVDAKHIQTLENEIGMLLLQRHHLADVSQADFSITSLQDDLKTVQQITSIFTLFLSAVASISLLVGGIGVMNIMIVSVTERTREIGIRKAVGARRKDIMLQFLVESILVSLLGGGSGILGGVVVAYLGTSLHINSGSGNPLTLLVTPTSVIVATTVSAAIGVFFGLYPAMRAARLAPIEALRYE